MTPYGPVSLALLHDLRMRSLSWAERGVLHHLSLLAGVATDGATIHLDRRIGEAPSAAWSRALGTEAAAIVGRLVELGLLTECSEGLRIVLVARPASTPTTDRAPAAAPEWTGKPSDSPSAERARNDRKKFRARVSPFSRVPTDLSWEAWIATEDGAAFLARRESEFPGYGERAVPRGTAPGTASGGGTYRPGTAPVPPPLPPPRTPPSFPEKKEEVMGGTAPGGTATGTGTGTAPPVPPLEALQRAAAGRATLTGAMALEQELGRLLARHALAADEIERAARAFADPSVWWPKGKHAAPRHVTLNDLAGYRGDAGYEWRALAALVAHVRATKPAAPRPAATPARAPVVSAEETRRALAAARGAPRDSSPPAALPAASAAALGGTP